MPSADTRVPITSTTLRCAVIGLVAWTACKARAPQETGSGAADGTPDAMEVGSGNGGASADGTPDARDAASVIEGGFSPSCHYDCFGHTDCVDGVVTHWAHTPVPCDRWEGTCPHEVVAHCQRGCGAAQIDQPIECPMVICRENIAKQPGDPCASDADCLPTRAARWPDGGTDTVSQVYLRCGSGGACVAAGDPTPPADWLGPCDPAALAKLDRGGYGFAPDPSCSGGGCVFGPVEDRGCRTQGCSMRCRSDFDCPQGAVCQDAEDACGPPSTASGYCKPGPRNLIGVGLTCR